jgi:hypothetical protein
MNPALVIKIAHWHWISQRPSFRPNPKRTRQLPTRCSKSSAKGPKPTGSTPERSWIHR